MKKVFRVIFLSLILVVFLLPVATDAEDERTDTTPTDYSIRYAPSPAGSWNCDGADIPGVRSEGMDHPFLSSCTGDNGEKAFVVVVDLSAARKAFTAAGLGGSDDAPGFWEVDKSQTINEVGPVSEGRSGLLVVIVCKGDGITCQNKTENPKNTFVGYVDVLLHFETSDGTPRQFLVSFGLRSPMSSSDITAEKIALAKKLTDWASTASFVYPGFTPVTPEIYTYLWNKKYPSGFPSPVPSSSPSPGGGTQQGSADNSSGQPQTTSRPSGWDSSAKGLVKCGLKSQDKPETTEVEGMCTRCDILVMFKNVIDFITFRVTPAIATLLILLSGFMLVLGGASPETITTGKKMFSNTIIGVIIVYSSFMIANFFIQSLAGDDNVAKNWFKLECTNPPPSSSRPTSTYQPSVNVGGFAKTPLGSTTPGGFKNSMSPELADFRSCLEGRLTTADYTIQSTTDTNIANGTCDPLGPGEKFGDSQNCQHRQNSQHYGGTSATCQAKGSFALDYTGNYDSIRRAALACNSRAFVLLETRPVHMHISIGNQFGCGSD